MPRNQFERMMFALFTVIITVHAYVFYSLYVINSNMLTEMTGEYYPYQYMDFNLFTLLANWLKLVCYHFPFAFFSQLFFIQPLIRIVFKLVFRRNEVPKSS